MTDAVVWTGNASPDMLQRSIILRERDWKGKIMGLRDYLLHDVIERNARLHGERLAFVADGERISHGEYALRVARLSAALASLGLVTGDRIAVLAHNCLAYVVLYGTAAQLGLILVPINWRLSGEEIAYVITDTTPKAVVAGTEFLNIIDGARSRLPFVQEFFTLGEACVGFEPFANLEQVGASTAPPLVVSGDSGYVILHTAAVGGKPRGALLHHAGLVTANQEIARSLNLSVEDMYLCALPLFHVFGLGMMLAVQHAGGATAVIPRFEARTAIETICAERVSVMAEFPPMLESLLDMADKLDGDLSSLRYVAGLDSTATINRFEFTCPQARFLTGYGQSEVSGFVSMARYRDRPGSAGMPTMLCRLRVVDDADNELPNGQTGEIVVRGPMVFGGYWNCDDDNEFTFRNGWHHTGDLGRFDDDGYLWYAGRSPEKELIKSGGENVYPAEVEKALLGHPAIAEAVVFGVPDEQWGEAIKAVCVCHPGHTVTTAELLEFIGARIARFKRPKHIVFVVAFPKSGQGLVDRGQVKQEFANA